MADLMTASPAEALSPDTIEFWNGLPASGEGLELWDAPDLSHFSGRMTRARIGEFYFIEVDVGAASTVNHSRTHSTQSRRSVFYLKVQLQGSSTIRQDGREARLSPGDFTLCDSTRRFEMLYDASSRLLIVAIPSIMLRSHVACAEKLTAVGMAGNDVAGELLCSFVRQLWSRAAVGIDTPVASHVTHAALNLIAGAYELMQAKPGRPSMSAVHRIRIRNYVEKHLTDHNLAPATISEACHIKSRYLRKLYETEDETLTRYILRRRLEECARILASPAHNDRSVTEIAFAYGFNSITHFGRVFRERFGMTPTMYRMRNTTTSQNPEMDHSSGFQVESVGREG
jgi:AraC-like DNA-binding protein